MSLLSEQEGQFQEAEHTQDQPASCAPMPHLPHPTSCQPSRCPRRPSILTEGPRPWALPKAMCRANKASEVTSSDSSGVRSSVSLACSLTSSLLRSQLHSAESPGLQCGSASRGLQCQVQGPALSQDGSALGGGGGEKCIQGTAGLLGNLVITIPLQFLIMSWRGGECRINSRRPIDN